MLNPRYCDYIAYEIKQALAKCIEEAQLDHGFWKKPDSPLIQAVGEIQYSESPGMDLTKKITVSDVNGKLYLITVEEAEEMGSKS